MRPSIPVRRCSNRDPNISGGFKEGDHGERVERYSLNGAGGGAPSGSSGSRVRAPGGGQGAKPPKAESFLPIFLQKVAKS